MGDHDHSYKLFFAHARMVRELLETFVDGDWLAQVDFDTLERVSDSYVSDDLRARADDIVWRVRCGSRHVYLLIEFQSRVDSFMAVRVPAYVALLYQDLIRARKVSLAGQGHPAAAVRRAHDPSDLWEKQTMLSERFDEWEAQFLMEGRRQGRQEGRAEGRKDGAATLLILQLRKRFGDLPDSVRTRVSEASSDELERWGERLLEVSSLDDVFSAPLHVESGAFGR